MILGCLSAPSVLVLSSGPLTSVCYFPLQVLFLKGKLRQDLRAGAPCPPPSVRPQFLPAGAQFARAAFELSRGTGIWSRATGLRSFSKMVPGSCRRLKREEMLSEEASL